jgi:hypothetical protein
MIKISEVSEGLATSFFRVDPEETESKLSRNVGNFYDYDTVVF